MDIVSGSNTMLSERRSRARAIINYDILLGPTLRSQARRVVGRYQPEEIYSSQREVNGLRIALDTSIRYHILPEEAVKLDREFGVHYYVPVIAEGFGEGLRHVELVVDHQNPRTHRA
jgi:hypothetical protein